MDMAHDTSQRHRCEALLAALNAELGWGLDTAVRRSYVVHLLQIVAIDTSSDADVRQILIRYHLDHHAVNALQDRNHPQYNAYWEEWGPQVFRILRRASLYWADDVAIDEEDLVQTAWAEMARSLSSFKYNSRLSTWAHQVITHSVQRVLRDSRAKKRAVRPSSLDQQTDLYLPVDERDHPEAQADVSALYDLACAVLSKHPDARLTDIFKLWQAEDASVTELGKMLHLSPQRIRGLIALIRELLRNDPAIRSWLGDEAPIELSE